MAALGTTRLRLVCFVFLACWRQRRQGRKVKENDRRIEETKRQARKAREIRR